MYPMIIFNSYNKLQRIITFERHRYYDVFSVIPLDTKYEKTLIRLQEAIENGMTDGDCESKYKCLGPTADDYFKT